MRALFSIIFRTLAWLVWLPAAGYVILQVIGGNGSISLIFILLGAAVITAPFAHYGQRLKYPAPPRERRQRRTPPPQATSPLPEPPPAPQGREIATPPFARKTDNPQQPVQGAMSPILQRFITDGAEDIDGRK